MRSNCYESRHLFDFESSEKIGDGCLFLRLEVIKHKFIQTQDEINISFDQNFVEKHWQTTGVIELSILGRNQTIEIYGNLEGFPL